MNASGRLPRHPLAFGITYWGPVPGTKDAHLMWDGPGAGIVAYPGDPTLPGATGQQVAHPSANKAYDTLADAERAVHDFAAIFSEQNAAGELEDAGYDPADAAKLMAEARQFPGRYAYAEDRCRCVVYRMPGRWWQVEDCEATERRLAQARRDGNLRPLPADAGLLRGARP